MSNEYISIQEASEISKKSIQTIRRAIKAKNIKFKKTKTPQGFNYVVDASSLCSFYKLDNISEIKNVEKSSVSQNFASADDIKSIAVSLEKMISQHSEERQNFMRLINTLNEKIFILENQLNLLKAPKKSWLHFWK